MGVMEYEILAGHLPTALGFEGYEVTGRSEDGGVDATGERHVANLAKMKILVQAKRYKPGSRVSAASVRQLRQAIPMRGQGAFITTAEDQRKAPEVVLEPGLPASASSRAASGSADRASARHPPRVSGEDGSRAWTGPLPGASTRSCDRSATLDILEPMSKITQCNEQIEFNVSEIPGTGILIAGAAGSSRQSGPIWPTPRRRGHASSSTGVTETAEWTSWPAPARRSRPSSSRVGVGRRTAPHPSGGAFSGDGQPRLLPDARGGYHGGAARRGRLDPRGPGPGDRLRGRGEGELAEKIAGYHSFHAARVAVQEPLRAIEMRQAADRVVDERPGFENARRSVGEEGDPRSASTGTSRGSGKRLTMAF